MSSTLASATYPKTCVRFLPSGYFLATENTGLTPGSSCKNKLSFENSFQERLFETINVCHGNCLAFFLYIFLISFLSS